MRTPDDRPRLRRMADQCDLVIADTAGFTYETFLADKLRYDATVMRLFTIGEDANSLSERIQTLAPEIPWHRLRGMRNIIAHGYFELRPDEIWKTAVEVLPLFRKDLARVLSQVP